MYLARRESAADGDGEAEAVWDPLKIQLLQVCVADSPEERRAVLEEFRGLVGANLEPCERYSAKEAARCLAKRLRALLMVQNMPGILVMARVVVMVYHFGCCELGKHIQHHMHSLASRSEHASPGRALFFAFIQKSCEPLYHSLVLGPGGG